MRGYGDSAAPEDIGAYTLLHLVGDMVGLVAALGESKAVIVGHDWGANVAWAAAQLRPDLFPAIAALSVPFRRRTPAPPLESLRKAGQENVYFFYFQTPGLAEAELERLPDWLSPEDLAVYVAAYRHSGFRGGLNWYRNIDRNWELLAPWQDAAIRQPVLFIAGSEDGVISIAGECGGAGADARNRAGPETQIDHRRCRPLDPAPARGRGEYGAARFSRRVRRCRDQAQVKPRNSRGQSAIRQPPEASLPSGPRDRQGTGARIQADMMSAL